MTFNEFKNEVKQSYAKYFDGSVCNVSKTKLYKSVWIKPYLVASVDEAINKILMNDMFNVSLAIFELDENNKSKEFEKENFANDDLEMDKNYSLEWSDSSYTIKPDNKYMVYSSRQVKFRKVVGSLDKILKAVDSYFKRLHESLVNDIKDDRIHENHVELLKKRIK